MFSRRSHLPRAENALTEALRRRRGAGQSIVDLTTSNPTRVGLDEPGAELRELFSKRARFDYEPEALGLDEARQAVAELWAGRGVPAGPAQVVVTASTSEAYSYAFRLLCDPGDEVLVPAPSYPLFEYLTHFEGVSAQPYRLGYDGSWHIDWASVRGARSAKTRAILLVNPNNPTGNYLSTGDVVELERLDLAVICDEVFNDYPHAGVRATSLLELIAERPDEAWRDRLVVVLDGLSKRCAMPQLKLAWMTLWGGEALVDEALARIELMADTYLSASTVTQSLLPELLRLGGAPRATLQARIDLNLAELSRRLADTPLSLLDVRGGWHAVVRLPALMDEERWVLELLDAGVLVQPGYFYDFATQAFIVLSLIVEPELFASGTATLVATVQRFAE